MTDTYTSAISNPAFVPAVRATSDIPRPAVPSGPAPQPNPVERELGGMRAQTERLTELISAKLPPAEAQAMRDRRIAAAWEAKAAEVRERHPDFDAIAFDEATPMTVPMMRSIVASDHGPDIAYWLGRNKPEAKRISDIADPISQALAIGRIEAKLRGAPQARQGVARRARPASQDEVSQKRIAGMVAELRKGNGVLGFTGR